MAWNKRHRFLTLVKRICFMSRIPFIVVIWALGCMPIIRWDFYKSVHPPHDLGSKIAEGLVVFFIYGATSFFLGLFLEALRSYLWPWMQKQWHKACVKYPQMFEDEDYDL